MKQNNTSIRIAVLACSLGSATIATATPTGLNNIPTADIVPNRTVAIQAFGSFGSGVNQFSSNGPGDPAYWMGFKTGLELSPVRLEFGMDSPLWVERSGPLLFQTKAGFEPWKNGKVTLGVAGVALSDFERSGDPFTYTVLSQDFGYLRGHVGYGIQTRGNTALIGIDRTWTVFDRNLNLNVDLVQANDQSYWLPAVGWKYELTKNLVFEWWTNLPAEGKMSNIAKINFVFSF